MKLHVTFLFLLSMLLTVRGEEERIQWSWQTMPNSAFIFTCNDTVLNVHATMDYVDWTTPGGARLQSGHSNDHYEVKDADGVPGLQLHVKRVDEATRGVYQCTVYSEGTAVKRASALRAINMFDHEYESLTEKYDYNIKVAFISTAVFLAPVVTMLLVYSFRYQTDAEKEKKRQKKAGTYKNPVYAPEMQEHHPHDMAYEVRSTEGKYAYEKPVDPELQTRM